jgi:putative phosphoesterase
MNDPSRAEWAIDGVNVVVLADCHIHPGGGPTFPPVLFDSLAGSDLIVTLGDMGEAAGLDQLAEIAPVIGVRGADDSDDPRTDSPVLVLTSGGLALGCVFDATKVGLAISSYPFVPAADFEAVAERLFGRRIDLLLHASTHRGEASNAGDCLVFNPGSAVLPAEGCPATFAALNLADGALEGRLVPLA